MAIRSRFWEAVPVDRVWRTYTGETRERLTEEGNAYLARTGEMPPRDGARADSESSSGGLRMTVHHDEANRPHSTFELQPGATKRNTWMAPYCGEMFEQIRICKTTPTEASRQAFENDWREVEQMRATGVITSLPEL